MKNIFFILLLSLLQERLVPITPLPPYKMERIVVKEKLYPYYRDPIEIEIVGPTKLVVLSRSELEETKSNSYTLFWGKKDKILAKRTFKAYLSKAAYYEKEKIPKRLTRAKRWILEVPRGRHAYKIWSSIPQSTLIRILIPEKAVRGGKK